MSCVKTQIGAEGLRASLSDLTAAYSGKCPPIVVLTDDALVGSRLARTPNCFLGDDILSWQTYDLACLLLE